MNARRRNDNVIHFTYVIRVAVLVVTGVFIGCTAGEDKNQAGASRKANKKQSQVLSTIDQLRDVRVVLNDLDELPCEIPIPQKLVNTLLSQPFKTARVDEDPARYMIVAVIRGQRGPSSSPTDVTIFVFSGWQRAKIDDTYYNVDLRSLADAVEITLRAALRVIVSKGT